MKSPIIFFNMRITHQRSANYLGPTYSPIAHQALATNVRNEKNNGSRFRKANGNKNLTIRIGALIRNYLVNKIDGCTRSACPILLIHFSFLLYTSHKSIVLVLESILFVFRNCSWIGRSHLKRHFQRLNFFQKFENNAFEWVL